MKHIPEIKQQSKQRGLADGAAPKNDDWNVIEPIRLWAI